MGAKDNNSCGLIHSNLWKVLRVKRLWNLRGRYTIAYLAIPKFQK